MGVGAPRRGSCAASAALTLTSLLCGFDPAAAGPQGGVVTAGDARIVTEGARTTITQGSGKAVIDWRGFDIDPGDVVDFRQPGADAIALNRVLSQTPTQIRGQLLANGAVWIVNRNGVVFHAGSVVDVGGLLATTADIDTADFMAGRMRFGTPGEAGAAIVNEGEITFGDAGLAAFVAPGVENRGVIAGKLGKVVIAGAETFAIDLAGDGLFAFAVKDGAGQATTTGRVENPGGHILITAASAQQLVESQVSVGGVVAATTAQTRQGRIVLSGDGAVSVTGALDAGATRAGERGGAVAVAGRTIRLGPQARIDVSGPAGGGVVSLGGGRDAAPKTPTARVAVAKGARIAADAAGVTSATDAAGVTSATDSAGVTGAAGDGGTVTIWSSEATAFDGLATARGGARGGDGGFVEISSAGLLRFHGAADLSAPHGAAGRLLFDPTDIVIGAVGAQDAQLGDAEILFGDLDGAASSFTLSADAINGAAADVRLEAEQDIVVDAPLNTPFSMSFRAGRDIVLNADVTGDGLAFAADADFSSMSGPAPDGAGTIRFTGGKIAGRTISLETGEALALGDVLSLENLALRTSADAVTQLSGAAITVGGALTLDAASVTVTAAGALTLGAVTADALDVAAGGAITQSGALSVAGAAGFAAQDGAAAQDVTLTQANAFGGPVSAQGAAVALTALGPLTLGAVTADALDVAAGGAITQSGALSVAGAAGFAAQDGATAQDVTLTQANAFGGPVSARGAAVALTALGPLTLGAVTADALDVAAGGAIDDSTGARIEVAGAARFDADGGAANIALDNDDAADRHRFGGAVSVEGRNLSLIADANLTLGAMRATGLGGGAAFLAARGGAVSDGAGGVLDVGGATAIEAAADIALDNAAHRFGTGGVSFSAGGDATIASSSGLVVRDSAAGGAVSLTALSGDLSIEAVTAGGALLARAAGGVQARDMRAAGATFGATGSTQGAASPAPDPVAIRGAIVGAGGLAAASLTEVALGDAAIDGPVTVRAPQQSYRYVRAAPWRAGAAVDFNADVAGDASAIDLLTLDRITFGADIAASARAVRFGFLRTFGDLALTALSGDVARLTDAEIDFAGAAAPGLSVALGRSAGVATAADADGAFGRLLDVGGAAAFAASGAVVVTTAANPVGGARLYAAITGPVSVAAAAATIEEADAMRLGAVDVTGDALFRFNADEGAAGDEALTQTPGDGVRVGGALAVVSGAHAGARDAAELGDVALTDGANAFDGVRIVARDAALGDRDGFQIAGGSLSGGLTVGAAAAPQPGDVALSDLDAGGDVTLRVAGSADLARVAVGGGGARALDVSAAGGVIASDLRVAGGFAVASAGGAVAATRFALGSGAFSAAGALSLTAGSLGAVTADAGGALALSDLALAEATATAGGALTADAVRAAGPLTLRGATVTLGTLASGGALTLEARAGDVALAADRTAAPDDVAVVGPAALTITPPAGGAGDTTGGAAGVVLGRDPFGARIDAAGAASLTATGAIALPREAVLLGGLHNSFSGPVTAQAGGSAVLATRDALSIAGAVAGDLSLMSNADNAGADNGVAQHGALSVGGALVVSTGDHGGAPIAAPSILGDVTLSALDNRFGGPVRVIAADAALTAAAGFDIAATRVGGDLRAQVVAGGAGERLSLADVRAGGAVTLSAPGAVTLSQVVADGALTAHSVSGALDAADVAAGGADLRGEGLALQRVRIAGALRADSGAGQATAEDLGVSGAASIDAGGAASATRFDTAGLTLSAGGAIALADGRAGDMAVTSAAGITARNLRLGALDARAGDGLRIERALAAGAVALSAARGDIVLGALDVGGSLTAAAPAGDIATTGAGQALAAVRVAAPKTGGLADTLAPEARATGVVTVTGDTRLIAGGAVALVDDATGAADNDFRGGVGARAGGDVMLNDANGIMLGVGGAAPMGIVAAGALRVEAGGAITGAGGRDAALDVGADALFIAGGDVLLANAANRVGGAVGAQGRDVTLSEAASVILGPVTAARDLRITAGAGGDAGDATIRQVNRVTVADAEARAAEPARRASGTAQAGAPVSRTGPIRVAGASDFSTGLDPALSLAAARPSADRALSITDPQNGFGGQVALRRIAGDATLVEESAGPASRTGPATQQVANWEVAGSSRIVTTDALVFLGRLSALDDAAAAPPRLARPTAQPATLQGVAGLAPESLRLDLPDGKSFVIDTTGAGSAPAGAAVRFDRPVNGLNAAPPLGTPAIGAQRAGLGSLSVTAGGGEIRFRDFVGAVNPIGAVTLRGGDFYAGFTFADAGQDALALAAPTRFLFDPAAPNDFLFTGPLRINVSGALLAAAPPGQADAFDSANAYFGINTPGLSFGDLIQPASAEAFGYIGDTRQRIGGLLPVTPQRGPQFRFNNCVVGDVGDCTNFPLPNVLNQVLIVTPPVLDIDAEALLELFGSFGNEELWGLPPSFAADFVSPTQPCAENDQC